MIVPAVLLKDKRAWRTGRSARAAAAGNGPTCLQNVHNCPSKSLPRGNMIIEVYYF